MAASAGAGIEARKPAGPLGTAPGVRIGSGPIDGAPAPGEPDGAVPDIGGGPELPGEGAGSSSAHDRGLPGVFSLAGVSAMHALAPRV